MFKVVLLGTGGPRPDPRRNATTTLIRLGDENILFDAGRGVVLQAVKAGVPLDTLQTPQYEAYDATIKVPYDPAKAEAMLTEAGWSKDKPVKFKIQTTGASYVAQIHTDRAS